MVTEARIQQGDSGQCAQCLSRCWHNYAPCPFCSPCVHYEQWKREQVGNFNFGSTMLPGVSKLNEECGEIVRIIGKLMSTSGSPLHWWEGDLLDELRDEMADVQAAITFVLENNDDKLSAGRFEDRVKHKLEKFREWHRRIDLPPTKPPRKD